MWTARPLETIEDRQWTMWTMWTVRPCGTMWTMWTVETLEPCGPPDHWKPLETIGKAIIYESLPSPDHLSLLHPTPLSNLNPSLSPHHRGMMGGVS